MGRAGRKPTSKIRSVLDLPAKYFKGKRKPPTPEEEAALAKAICELAERVEAVGRGCWGDEPEDPGVITVRIPSSSPDKLPELPPLQEAIRRIRKEYPDGVAGIRFIAAVCRKIGMKPDTTKRALVELGWQKPKK
jgi:hypothetical protein